MGLVNYDRINKKDRSHPFSTRCFYLSHNIMIITKTEKKFKYLTQQLYNLTINKLDLSTIQCDCGQKCTFIYHGSYSRNYTNGKYSTKIMITRILCTCCKHTHAILIQDMVPYSSYSYSCIIESTDYRSTAISCETLLRYYRHFIGTLSSVNYFSFIFQKIRSGPLILFPT